MTIHSEFIGHPSAWKASDFANHDDLAFHLTPAHLQALEEALVAFRRSGRDLYDTTREDFTLPAMVDDLAAILRELFTGRGIVLMRGFPVDRYVEDDLAVMYWAIGTHIGTAVSQTVLGDRIGRVVNVGDLDPNERAYRNRRELRPHTDRSHVIGMLCVRQAKSGGASGYVNGIAAHNVVAEEHPEHLQILYRGFAKHQFGEEEAGEAPFSAPTPIFSVCEGVPTMQYIRGYYDMAKEEAGEPYSAAEEAALDFLDEVTLRPEMKLDILHAPGDVSFINNHVIMHSRTEFADHEDPRRGRLLLRLWLHAPGSRPLIAALTDDEAHAGVSENRERETPYFGRWKRDVDGPD